jgi:hypothetical protein
VAARRKLAVDIDEINRKIIQITPPNAVVAARLLECNLISGVYNAAA